MNKSKNTLFISVGEDDKTALCDGAGIILALVRVSRCNKNDRSAFLLVRFLVNFLKKVTEKIPLRKYL